MKKFSIITITWNNAKGLKRTLDSIRALDYSDKELIVIDGASSDDTPDVIAANKDIVTMYISEKDSGIYNAMNKGLRYVTGDYVVFMNAGDCFAGSDTLDVVGHYDGEIILGSARYGDEAHLMKESMTLYDIISTGINHQSTYYKADIIKKYGLDENYRLLADFKSVVEPMAKDHIKVISIPDILSSCEGGGVSKERWRDTIRENRKIVREVVEPYYIEETICDLRR